MFECALFHIHARSQPQNLFYQFVNSMKNKILPQFNSGVTMTNYFGSQRFLGNCSFFLLNALTESSY